MLDCLHQVCTFGKPRSAFSYLSLLLSSMVYTVRFDKDNQRITLLYSKSKSVDFSSYNLHAPVALTRTVV